MKADHQPRVAKSAFSVVFLVVVGKKSRKRHSRRRLRPSVSRDGDYYGRSPQRWRPVPKGFSPPGRACRPVRCGPHPPRVPWRYRLDRSRETRCRVLGPGHQRLAGLPNVVVGAVLHPQLHATDRPRVQDRQEVVDKGSRLRSGRRNHIKSAIGHGYDRDSENRRGGTTAPLRQSWANVGFVF